MARTKLDLHARARERDARSWSKGLVRAGASVFRLNFSHGTPEEHARMVELVRGAERSVGRPSRCSSTSRVRRCASAPSAPDPFPFKPGQRFDLRPSGAGDDRGAATTYPALAEDLREGDRVLLADGAVELTVTGSATASSAPSACAAARSAADRA